LIDPNVNRNYFESISQRFCESYTSNPANISLVASFLSSAARRGHTGLSYLRKSYTNVEEVATALISITDELDLENLLEKLPDSSIEKILCTLLPLSTKIHGK
jgi:type IV secretory pathway VirB4 component